MKISMMFRSVLFLLILVPWAGVFTVRGEEPVRYGPGEKLHYNINFAFVPAGDAYLFVKRDTLGGKEIWHIKLLGSTSGLADVIYKVRDRYECYMDPFTQFPLKAIRDIHEGNYKKYNEVIFNHNAREDSSIVYSQARGEVVVPKNIYDVLTGFYYFREHYAGYPFKKRETVLIQTYFTDELWPLKIRYLGKEVVKIGKKKVRCLRFGPVTEVGRAFKKENDMSMWLTDDDNFLPVKIWVNLKVGSFRINLADYEGLRYPISAFISKE